MASYDEDEASWRRYVKRGAAKKTAQDRMWTVALLATGVAICVLLVATLSVLIAHYTTAATDNKHTILYTRDFRDADASGALTDDFAPFPMGAGGSATDGTVSFNARDGLVVDSRPFTTRHTEIYDHVKYLVLTKTAYPTTAADGESELYVEALLSFEAHGILAANGTALQAGVQKYAAGLKDARHDPRLATAALNMIDLASGMVFDFLLSNTTVYALYEHLPYTNATEIFTYAWPVASRSGALDEPMALRISYDRVRARVTWWVDGARVHTVDNVGLPTPDRRYLVLNCRGYAPARVDMQSMVVGFGTFALLDFLPFDGADGDALGHVPSSVSRYARYPDALGNPVPAQFVYNGAQENDGQGAVLRVRQLRIGRFPVGHPPAALHRT